MFTSRTQATSYPALPLNPFAASTCEILNRLYPAKFHPLENLPAPAARRHSSFSLQENWLLSSLFATLTKSSILRSLQLLCLPLLRKLPGCASSLPILELPHTRSATVPSIRWKKNNPPATTTTTIPVDASSNNPGAFPCPVIAHRNPSITPAIGFSP